ncbi:MAG TPA: hypothetical protein VNU68_09835 [Verrucomicrobiae bacterium]|nr:hypothetical protein [Verrucomicrobiae bacterium]
MFHLIPTKTQWREWSLPSKLTCIGAYLGVLSIVLTVVFFAWPSPEPLKVLPSVDVGKDSVAIGRVSGSVGDRSVVVGATDSNGNTIITLPMAVGYNAQAGPGSIAIGANARAGVPSGAQEQLNERLRQADEQYTSYQEMFRNRVDDYAAGNLEKIFDECISMVTAADPTVGELLKLVEIFDVPSSQVARELTNHQELIRSTIFKRFNANLMDDLRAHSSGPGYSNWMTAALREWTHIKNQDSILVELCISNLVANPDDLGSWVKAYVRRQKEPTHWSSDNTDAKTNQRLRLLQKLDMYVGLALNEGRDEVLAIVRRNFPDDSAIPAKLLKTK